MKSGIHTLVLRMKALLNMRRMDRELAEELEFHQAMLREKLLQQGMTSTDVNQAARRTFGNASRWHERLRELWQFRGLENFLRDVSFSARLLKKSPGFTAVALLTLAIGVGANTAIFSLINGLLLRPLPVPHPDQLVVLSMQEGGASPDYSFPTPFFRALEHQPAIFSDVFAYNNNGELLQLQGRSGNENVRGMLVSGQFFQALQTPPLLGRYLTAADDQTGGNPAGLAAVISENFWRRWFNRDPNVVGRKLVIANVPFTVAGVMPKRFIGADLMQRPEIFVPLSAEPIIDAPRHNLDEGLNAWWLTVVARLQPGVNLQQANAALRTVSGPILHTAAEDPAYVAQEDKAHFHFEAAPGSGGFTMARFLFRSPLLALLAMCGGILLLACLNLASLLIARGAMRERELATRLAMGATRWRLIQQLLIESLLLAGLGTIAGIAITPVVSNSLTAFLTSSSGDPTVVLDASLDLRVLVFAAVIAIVSAVLIGLMPALQATAGNLNDHIKDGQHARQLHEQRWHLPRVLMASEVALALVLVVGAGLLATSLLKLYRSGVGFDPKGLANISFSMDKQQLQGDALMRVYQELGQGLSRQPGVKSVSFQFITPLSHRGWNGNYSAPGGNTHVIWLNSVGPNYFKTMRIPIYMGREFRWNDTNASGLKIILNQSAASLLFPDHNALGQQIVDPSEKTSYQIVAVVADAKYRSVMDPAPPAGYVPIQQDEQKKPSLSAVVRVDGPMAPLAAAARSLSARLTPTIPPPILTTMDEVLNNSISAQRMLAILSLFFAGCALLITAIGLYGTLAYATARRTSEIGIRMALGAKRGQVIAMVFRQNAWVAIAGCIAGMIAAVLATRAMASFLFETSPRDPWVLLASIAVLLMISSCASLLPALQAARIDPMLAIRCE
jgi:predicted permease